MMRGLPLCWMLFCSAISQTTSVTNSTSTTPRNNNSTTTTNYQTTSTSFNVFNDTCAYSSAYNGGEIQVTPSNGIACRCRITNTANYFIQLGIAIRLAQFNANSSQYNCQPFAHYHLDNVKYEMCSANMSNNYANSTLLTSLPAGSTIYLDLFDTLSIGTTFGLNLIFGANANYNVSCSSSAVDSPVQCPCPLNPNPMTTTTAMAPPSVTTINPNMSKSQIILISCCCGLLAIILIAAVISAIFYVREKKAKAKARQDNVDGRNKQTKPKNDNKQPEPRPAAPKNKETTLSNIAHLIERLMRIVTNKERDLTFHSENTDRAPEHNRRTDEFKLSTHQPQSASMNDVHMRNVSEIPVQQEIHSQTLPIHQSSPNMKSDIGESRDSGFTVNESNSNYNSTGNVHSMQYNGAAGSPYNPGTNQVYVNDGYATTSGVTLSQPAARRQSNDSGSMTGSSVFAAEPCYNPEGRRSGEPRRPGSRYASANSVQDMAVNGRRPLTPPMAQKQLPPLSLSDRRSMIKDGNSPIYAQSERNPSMKSNNPAFNNNNNNEMKYYRMSYPHGNQANVQQYPANCQDNGQLYNSNYQQQPPQQPYQQNQQSLKKHSPQYQKEFSEHQQRLQNMNNQINNQSKQSTEGNTHEPKSRNGEAFLPLTQGAPLAGIETNI